ncbi:MAG: flagellar hook protein FlgE [Pseudomonadota bacterium]
MSFAIALSGLNAASDDLSVTANNIANASTNGFKQSRPEFAEIFAVASDSVASNQIGNGVRLSNVRQEFTQGNVDFTGNSLDLAVTGQGFFTLSDNGALQYTRAGQFTVDREGFVGDVDGRRLQVYPPVGNGTFNTGGLTDLQLITEQNPPVATENVVMGVNLPADSPVPDNPTFDTTDPLSFNHTTSITIHDSLGATHTASVFYVKTAVPNEWDAHLFVDGVAVSPPNTIAFDAGGQLVTPVGGIIAHPALPLTNGADPLTINLDIQQTTQFGGDYSVNALSQDGLAAGRLTGIEIDASGVVFARFDNGRTSELGKVALANFVSVDNLGQIGDTNWIETFGSGEVLQGEAGTSSFGLIQSGALEASNVDLTAQLVNMISAQRNFQANAQVISTTDQITQTIINLR